MMCILSRYRALTKQLGLAVSRVELVSPRKAVIALESPDAHGLKKAVMRVCVCVCM